jgi:hypothetical protein
LFKNSDNPCDDGQGVLDDTPSNNNPSGDADIPLNDPPPHNVPSDFNNIPLHRSLLNGVPRNILAFRTITTMLTQIQQNRPFKISDIVGMSDMERQELKISNAISTVAVANHDIVAVVAKRAPKKLEVTACTHAQSDSENPVTLPSLTPSIMSRTWQLLFTKNFRRDDPKPAIPILDPIIIDATIPAGLEQDDDEGLRQYLERRW